MEKPSGSTKYGVSEIVTRYSFASDQVTREFVSKIWSWLLSSCMMSPGQSLRINYLIRQFVAAARAIRAQRLHTKTRINPP